MKAITAARMRELDRAAIEDFGIPGILLMENAGRAVADAAESLARERFSRLNIFNFAILCGSGNNGGDGLVAARYLFNRGHGVVLCLMKPPEGFSGDAAANFGMASRLGIPIERFAATRSFPADAVIIDALLGTGTRGEIAPAYREAVTAVNNARLPVVAVDIPSGIDADTGASLGAAVRADVTVTMGLMKQGMLAENARGLCGRVIVAEIGLPRPLL